MRPSHALEANREARPRHYSKTSVRNVRVFGSVLHEDDTEASDLDLLVDPTPQTTLLYIAAIQIEAERELGLGVDVLTPKSLPASFRERVVREAVPL